MLAVKRRVRALTARAARGARDVVVGFSRVNGLTDEQRVQNYERGMYGGMSREERAEFHRKCAVRAPRISATSIR